MLFTVEAMEGVRYVLEPLEVMRCMYVNVVL
jgi:hypothetical protein